MTIYCGHEEFLDIHESFLFQGLRQIWNKIRERIHPLSRKMFFTEQGKSFLRKLTPDLEMNVVVSKDITRDQATLHAETRPRMAAAKDDSNSVSTVSGSGRDFFRKFVSRKDSSYKDCEEHFRREVLIDRLVSDSINTKAILARTRSSRSSTQSRYARPPLSSPLRPNPPTARSNLTDYESASPEPAAVEEEVVNIPLSSSKSKYSPYCQ